MHPTSEEPDVLDAAMVVIGDELLAGHVTDINSPLFAQTMQLHGVPVRSIRMVADEHEAIATALAAELDGPRPRLLVTSGGIGSTPDDLTYEAVARGLDRKLTTDARLGAAVRAVLDRTSGWGVSLTEELVEAMWRMAQIPAGSRLLAPQLGFSAGVALDLDGGVDAAGGATLVIMPGVPNAFRRLLLDQVVPQLVAGRNPDPVTLELTHPYPEHLLNQVFTELLTEEPSVSLGSYPGEPSLVRLTGPDQPAVDRAAERVRAAITALDASGIADAVGRWRAARRAPRQATMTPADQEQS